MPSRLKPRMMATRDGFQMQQDAEVEDDDDGDEGPQQQEEFALGDEVGLAGLVDEFGDFAHGAVDGQVLQPPVDDQAEAEAEQAEQNADQEQLVAVDGAVEEADGERSGSLSEASPPVSG